ncbi:RdRP-domain-containing protein [Trametopsis cervina]|nr:RdRP-domain-containing protein [Trametopsis cervina]
MELYINNIDPSATVYKLKRAIAQALHGSRFRAFQAMPINFEVVIYPQNTAGQLRSGALTVPTNEIGRRFLQEYTYTMKKIMIGNRALAFKTSHRAPRLELVQKITMLPYVDPQALEERQAIIEELRSRQVQVTAIQFGWECRDGAFSIEWERQVGGQLIFDLDKREYRVTYELDDERRTVAIRSSQVSWAAMGTDVSAAKPSIFFSLYHPPRFEGETLTIPGGVVHDSPPGLPRSPSNATRRRRSALEDDHIPYAPYTSLAVRFVCSELDRVEDLEYFAELAHIRTFRTHPACVRLGLFSPASQAAYATFIATLQFEVAFQVEALVRNHLVDLQELLKLRKHIEWMVSRKKNEYTAAFIRHLGLQAREPSWHKTSSKDPVETLADTFACLHVVITPTRMVLDGPFPEKNNRVMRQYPDNVSSFLRVSFKDDDGLQYRMDRDVDDRAFIHERFGGVLNGGIHITSHHFEFLAYSQSGLKQHAVWFMKNFVNTLYGRRIAVTPDSIINSIGIFNTIEYDSKLVYCPARLGARYSQAFTATEAAVSVDAEEILFLADILDDKDRSFTEGVGTVSREFAIYIWEELKLVSRRHARNHQCEYPPAFQVRCQGSKGMLSVDYTLPGRQLCLRRSMIKFEAPHSSHVEVVTAFTSPGKFYLNRPLVMMLEGLEIAGGYEILKELQAVVIAHTKEAYTGLDKAARLFESYGVGSSFKLASVFLGLDKLGIRPRHHPLFGQLIDLAVHHVLRELKYHARIPVPDGWTLPGVADIHGYLQEGEIFACITSNDGSEPHYLEGPTMVFRSPTSAPGDIQVVTAIGKPPPQSPFFLEPLRNTVVFATKGARPLASCLAGGDLDGDVFVCCTLEKMLPTVTYDPAEYAPGEKRILDRPSTRQDIANFVTEYLYSDNIGLIASAWLLRADSSDKGIHDPDCLTLAQLHSDAVDYAKTGKPVPLQSIPRNNSSIKPDWSRPELAVGDNTKLFYESQRWLGQLFREIKLPEPRMPRPFTSRNHDITLDAVIEAFRTNHSKTHVKELWTIFHEFAFELRTICASSTMSTSRSAMLTEEEALVGTIAAKSSLPRRRKELVAYLREQTTHLSDRTARQVSGPDRKGEDDTKEHAELALKRAWVAFGIGIIFRRAEYFGSLTFFIVALAEIFDALKRLEYLSSIHP